MAGRNDYRIFISAVSREFNAARDAIANSLQARGLTVKVQRAFRTEAHAATTLQKLHDYIRDCDAVIALVGRYSGGFPPAGAVTAEFSAMLPAGMTEASFTQWEVIFALHYGKRISFHEGAGYAAEREPAADDDQPGQTAWSRYLFDDGLGRDRRQFAAAGDLRANVLEEEWPSLRVNKPRNLPFSSLGTRFKGRAAALKSLRESFAGSGSAAAITSSADARAVHGLGGVGKTRLAIEYALRYDADYSALLFVTGKTPDDLTGGLAGLVEPPALDLPEQTDPDQSRRLAAVLAWLETHPGWLMIIDNADTEAAARAVLALMPRLNGGDVLITSRIAVWGGIQTLPLDVLAAEDAAAFLIEATPGRRKGDDDAAMAALLAENLGFLALALTQAAAFISVNKLSFKDYLGRWERARDSLLGWHDDLAIGDYPVSVAATWLASFEQLGEHARALLSMLAYLSVEPVPEFLLDAVPEEAEDRLLWRNALAELARYSFVSRDDDAPEFTVHRLVQQVARDRMSQAEKSVVLGAAVGWVRAALSGRNPGDVRNWHLFEPLLPHARSLFGFDDSNTPPGPMGALLNAVGLFLKTSNRLAEAEPLYRRALAIDENRYGPDHPDVATWLNNLAGLLQATNRLAEAEPLYRRALAIDENSYGPDHPEVATDLNNLAGLLQATNRLAEAEPLYRRAFAIGEKSLGPDHSSVAIRLNNLAYLLQATNRLAEAEPLIRRALEITEKSLGPDHPDVGTALNNLAGLLRATNRLAEAEPLFERVIDIFEKNLGPDHPDVGTALNNLADLLRATNRLAEAEPLIRRALAIGEKSLGPDHPSVAIRLNNLAGLLQATNRLAEAEPLSRRMLQIFLKFTAATGHSHPYLEAAIGNHGVRLEAMGRSRREVLSVLDALFREAGFEPPQCGGWDDEAEGAP